LVAAKDLSVGDKVLSVQIAELDPQLDTEIEFTIGNSLTIVSEGFVETTITNIVKSEKDGITYFNGDTLAKYSSEQPVFVRSNNEFVVKVAGNVVAGDMLVKILEDGTYTEEEVLEITVLDVPGTVYQFSCDDYHWFIAGGYLVHNK
jgi:intein/homing endonuclease